MESKLNTKPELNLNNKIPFPFTAEQMNNMPAGSYIIKDGELIPADKATKNLTTVKAELKEKDKDEEIKNV